MIIGLTGKSCSGKDFFASLLDKNKFEVIDEDHIGHIALEDKIEDLAKAFGNDILKENGTVNRKKLGGIVFSDSEKLSLLNSIVHPYMVSYTLKLCNEIIEKGKIPVINAALLEKMGFVQYCDQIILVLSDYSYRLERAIERDGISKDAFEKRTNAQAEIGTTLFSSGKKIITIFNNGTEEQLYRQVKYYCDTI